MNPLLDRIAKTVLYEGYILYPYRPALKNRQRWNFGGLVPPAYSLAQCGTEACTMQTECLAAGGAGSRLAVTVRFLHLVDRQVGELTPPSLEWPTDREPPFHAVESLEIGGQRFYAWQEAVERTIQLPNTSLGEVADRPLSAQFRFPRQNNLEPLRCPAGQIAGILVRQQQAIEGSVEMSTERVGDGRFKLRVRIRNQTPLADAGLRSRDKAMLHSLVATHTILTIDGGEFKSLMDPPEEWRTLAADCRNEGTWPVLVGDNGATDVMLSAPIILYDYPQAAAESAGDYFDATEIDEMLALRVLTLTAEEKEAMAAIDERARAILQRTHSLAEQQLRGLHGAVRDGGDS